MTSNVFVILLWMALTYVAECGFIYFKTIPTHYSDTSHVLLGDYGYPTGTSMVFQVKLCSSGYIYLMSSSSSILYTVLLQGYGNAKSQIRRGTGTTEREYSESGLLDCNAFKMFRISWNNNKISLDKSSSCGWVNMISVTRDASVSESDIQKIGIKTSTYATNQPGYWKIHTTDEILTASSYASSDWEYLSQLGYSLGTSTSMQFRLESCDTVSVALFRTETSAGKLYEFTIQSTNAVVSNTNGDTDSLTGITQDCNTERTFEINWSGNDVRLTFTNPPQTLTASVSQPDQDISYIGYKSSSSARWLWKLDNAGSCFTLEACNPATCATHAPTTTTTTESPSTTTTEAPTTTTTTVSPTTTTTESPTTTTTESPTTTTTESPTTTTTESPTTTTTESPTTTTTKSPTTTTVGSPTTESTTTTTTETATTSWTKSPTTTTTELSTTTYPSTTQSMPMTSSSVANTCCCVSYALLLLPDDELLPTVVIKSETTLYKRSLTSAYDDRTSAAYIGYIGTIFLCVTFIGIIIVDIPNLIKMVRTMKRNLGYAPCKQSR